MASVDVSIGPPRTDINIHAAMKALVYHGPGQRSWDDCPRPAIQERGDAIVRITATTICGICDCCQKGMPSHCRASGWVLGNTIDGTQAEYVRVPHADTSLYSVSPDLDGEDVVMLSDTLPTAYDTFGDAATSSALKVILRAPEPRCSTLTMRSSQPRA